MFNKSRFIRMFYTFRIDQLKRIVSLDNTVELPLGSCLHVLDGWYRSPTSDVPDIEGNLFIHNERYDKYLVHIKSPQVANTDAIEMTDPRYMFINTRMSENFTSFRRKAKNFFIYKDDIQSIPDRDTILPVINHNPLFRLNMLGKLPKHRKFMLMMASVFNVCDRMPNKTHYIPFPWTNQVYRKESFTRSMEVLDIASVKFQNDYQYLFMMHLLNYIRPQATTSLFSRIPEGTRSRITFILQMKDYAIFYNLNDIVNLCNGGLNFEKILNHLNLFSLSSTENENINKLITIETTQDLLKKEDSPVGTDIVDKDDPVIHSTDRAEEVETPDTHIDIKTASGTQVRVDRNRPAAVKTPVKANSSAFKSAAQQKRESQAKQIVAEDEALDPKVIDVTTQIDLAFAEITKRVNEAIKTLTKIQLAENGHNVTSIAATTDAVVVETRAVQTLSDIDKQAEEYIDAQQDITPEKKAQLKTVALKYKTIELNGVTLETILTKSNDVTIEKGDISAVDGAPPVAGTQTSTSLMFDSSYIEKTMTKDIVGTVVELAKNGMFLVEMTVKDNIDELNQVRTHKIVFEDKNGKRHSMVFQIPLFNRNGVFVLNGTPKLMKKQLFSLSIVKVSPTRVTLTSDTNKTMVERNTASAYSFDEFIVKLIKNINKMIPNSIRFEYRNVRYNLPIAYEYTTLACKFKQLEFSVQLENKPAINIFWSFDYENRKDLLPQSYWDQFSELESKYGTLFGKSMSTSGKMYFIDIDSVVSIVDLHENTVSLKTCIIALIKSISPSAVSSMRLFEWCDIKVLDKKFPVIFLLCYRYGLTKMLEYLQVKHEIVSSNAKVSDRMLSGLTSIVINFSDQRLVIPRYPLTKSLIFSGLKNYDLSDYSMDQFDSKEVYFSVMMDKRIPIYYLKQGIDDFFDFFIDTRTRDVLEQMKEPTNERDLLIRAVALLATEDHVQASDIYNFRLRSTERCVAILHAELVKALKQQKKRASKGFSINPNAVLQAISNEQAVALVDSINPIHDIKEQTTVTYTGTGGRSEESFVVKDRIYPESAIGVVSEATPDNGNVGLTANLSLDATIANTRGIILKTDKTTLDPAQVLSVTALLMPCATNDDSKRTNFINIQLSHHIPTVGGETSRIRTGYERIIAQRTSSQFAGVARENGIVKIIDTKLQMVRVEYEDDSTDVFTFGDEFSSSSGLFLTQRLVCNFVEGEAVKKGDVVVYNSEFFQQDPFSKQVDWKHGVHANVALMQSYRSVEDGNAVSQELAAKLTIKPATLRTIALDKNVLIHRMVDLKQEVHLADSLVVYEDGDIGELTTSFNKTDSAVVDLLDQMNRRSLKAQTSGTVAKIDVFYSVPVEQMHPSLAKIVRKIVLEKNKRAEFAKGTDAEYTNLPSKVLPSDTKLKKSYLDKNMVVIQFYIQEEYTSNPGDKVVFDSSLKSVTSEVVDTPMHTKSGVIVDAIFSCTSILSRIINSPILTGIGQRVLEQAERNILQIWGRK